MEEMEKRIIPAWLWPVVTVFVVAPVLALAVPQRRADAGPSTEYDVSSYVQVNPKDVIFKEGPSVSLKIGNPSGLAIGPAGQIYAAGENAVLALDSEGKETARYPVKGRPNCLAASPDGEILLGMSNHIEVFDSRGSTKAVWKDLNDRACLTSITADDESVFAADAGNRVVLHFDRDGNLQGRIGERDKARQIPGLIVPSPYLDVALDAQGSLWVVNPGKHGIENYRPNGDLVSSWYQPGMDLKGFCGCCNPIHIAFRSDGSVATAEKGLNRVKLYGPDMKLLGVVAGPDAIQSPDKAAFSCDVEPPIRDLAVDSRGRILVLDGLKMAIRVFEPKE